VAIVISLFIATENANETTGGYTNLIANNHQNEVTSSAEFGNREEVQKVSAS
jgi:hypothetical protein